MMRDNESDGADGWPRPEEYVSPWAPRDGGRSAQDPGFSWVPPSEAGPVPGPASPRDERQDTVSFGRPDAGPPSSGYGDYRNPPGYGDYGNPPGYGDYGNPPGYGEPPVYTPPPPRGPRRFGVYVAVAALAASIGAGVTVALDSHDNGSSTGTSASDVPGPHNNAVGTGSATTLNKAAVERKVEPGLVDITSTLRYRGETAEGTGMIISSSGLVLTNNHVIDQATSVKATLVTSRHSYRARIVGYDSSDDVALLQLIGASGLPMVSFGNSAQITLGTPVLALGNADGKGGVTPARGIINALNRSIQASDQGSDSTEDLNHMLQTNALIQQGDSGGALANSAGQVIGMITAANTASSGQVGQSGGTLGFAIPINSALDVARQIAAGQSSSTVYIGLPGFLGVEVAQSNSPSPQQQAADEQQSSGGSFPSHGGGQGCQTGSQPSSVPNAIAPASSGALILGILCGTAADSRGLVPGDVIISVNGHAVTTPGSLTGITARYRPGDIVAIVWEGIGGKKHTLSIRLGSGPAR